MINSLLSAIRRFGATIKGKNGTYCMKYKGDEYVLLVNADLQLFSFAKYVTAYKGKLKREQFNDALETVQYFHSEVTGYYNGKRHVGYLSSPDFSYDDAMHMSKEAFDEILKDFDDAYIIMFGTVFAITDPTIPI